MKINTIRQNKEEKKVNQNLMWISAEIPPLKPDNASRYMRYKTYPVIVDYKYNDGCVDEVLDFCDYDFEEKKWKLDNPHKVRQYFPLPSKHKVKCSNKKRTFVRKIS